MRAVVTGASGRLGSALVEALGAAPYTGPSGPIAWDRRAFDLDAPDDGLGRLDADRAEVVVHAAAWTDVDACAAYPDLAMRRNAIATAVLARACAERDIDLILVSTNEVFDGTRTDGRGYVPTDQTAPANPYGASKLAGEAAARAAFEPATAQLAIVRTAWLFGPGRPDFPRRILDAAVTARDAGRSLRVVDDEVGNPTYVADLADAIVELIGGGSIEGAHHIVNGPPVSRAAWAADVVARAGLPVEIEAIPSTEWQRPSTPPRWGALELALPPTVAPPRSWQEAMADYAPVLLREHARAMTEAAR